MMHRLVHVVTREEMARVAPRMWFCVLQCSMETWEHKYRELPCAEEAAAATEWEIAERIIEFAQIHPDAFRAVGCMVPQLSRRWIQKCFPEGFSKGMSPPMLPNHPDTRWTWSGLRCAMEEGRLTAEDATILMRSFGKPSLGTHFTLVRRLEWILPPVDCAWHPWAKEALWRISRRQICATNAKRKFRIADRDLQKLVPRCVDNPRCRNGPPMRLYEMAEVARVASQKSRHKQNTPIGSLIVRVS